MDLNTIKTPSLVLDVGRVRRNAETMSARIKQLGASSAPARQDAQVRRGRSHPDGGRAGARLTVSTLAEARAFAAGGFTDITYAVPVEPGKFEEAAELSKLCERFALITDDVDIRRCSTRRRGARASRSTSS